jgi:hypothetical protein
MFIPALIIIVGLVWLFTNLGIISDGAWDIILPLAVILFGITMYTKHSKCCKPSLLKSHGPHEGHGPGCCHDKEPKN